MIVTFTLCISRACSEILEVVVLKMFSGGASPPDLHLSPLPLPQQAFSIAKVKLTCFQFKEVRGLVVSATLVYKQIRESII